MSSRLALSLLVLSTAGVLAQDAPIPPVVGPIPTKYPAGPPVSRLDLYGLYSYFHPVNSDINNIQYQPINPGAVAGVTGYFSPHFGLQAEGSFFPHGPDDCVYTAQAGPVARYQIKRFVPFVHVLAGGAKVGGPVFQPCTWGYGVTAGLGLDYILPGFHDRLALRPIQADYEYSHVDYGPLVVPADVSGGLGQIQAYRLSGGLVVRLGDMTPPPPVALACTVLPTSGFTGDPFTASATATNLNPKKPATYSWTTSGGQISGSASSAPITTKGVGAGSYTVSGRVTQGPLPYQSAACTSSFTIRDYDPPTLSCSADPATVVSGSPSTITSVANSPQNRMLTYSYAATRGQISGSGASVTLATSGLNPGPVDVTCNVVDDLGKAATASTSVMVNALPVPPVPQPAPLCGITFDRDHKRPNRVDNEAKACLDDLALNLQRDPAAHLVVVGNHAEGESDRDSAERAANVRLYLTAEKGIDPMRIEIRTGSAGSRTVDDTLIPDGATFQGTGTTVVDPNNVTVHGSSYGKPKTAPR